MAVDLTQLIQLHFLDQKISALDQEISKIPIQIQDLERKLERFQRAVREKQELLAENQKKRRELEGDLALIETKRDRYKEQLDSVKTNKEYTGLQHEIETVSHAIRGVEDQILATMEEAEHLKRQMQEAQGILDQEEQQLIRQKTAVETEGTTLRSKMDELKEERQKQIRNIAPDTLDIYHRTASHRKGVAMAEAKDELCQVCQMRIRPQLFQEIRKNDSIITCESCSRILFYLPPEEN